MIYINLSFFVEYSKITTNVYIYAHYLILDNQMKVKQAKISKIGDSFFVRIPKQYINNEEINPKKLYNLEILEAKK